MFKFHCCRQKLPTSSLETIFKETKNLIDKRKCMKYIIHSSHVSASVSVWWPD